MSRVERYWTELLDKDNQFIRRINRVSGKLTLNVNREIRGGGKIEVVDEHSIDWMSTRVRCWYGSNETSDIALGTFLPTFPEFNNGGLLLKQSIDLHDTTKILVDDRIEDSITIAEGAVITDAIRDILLSAGVLAMAVTDSEIAARSTQTWRPGTTKLRIINDLLKSINYFSVWTDGMGVFHIGPYARPAARPRSFLFRRGKDATHSPYWNRQEDLSEIPNKVVLLAEGSDEEEGLRGFHTNMNPDSRFSYQSRGNRWITHTEEVEAADQQTIDDLARRRLIDLSSPSATIEVEHLQNGMLLNSVGRFISGSIDTLATVERMDITMTPGKLVKTQLREVQDL